MTRSVRQAAPQLRIARFRSKIDEAIRSVRKGVSDILGSAVEAFETAFAAHEGRVSAVGVGSDVIALALRPLGVYPGNHVIVPAWTFSGTAHAVLHAGAPPRCADVDPTTSYLTAETLEAALTPFTSAIVSVHLFGYPGDLPIQPEVATACIEQIDTAPVAACRSRRAQDLDGVATCGALP